MNNAQYCIVTRSVVENNFEISRFGHLNTGINDQASLWLFMHGDEKEGFMDDEDNYLFVELSEVIFNQPFIREYLDAPVESEFYYDRSKDRVEDWTKKRTITFERKIYAPNAANVKLGPRVWLKYFPGDVMPAVIAGVFVIPAVMHHPAWLLLSAVFALRLVVSSARLMEHFKLGEAKPAIVVSTRPCLIAVEHQFDDKGQPRRFVKIVRIKLSSIGGRPIELGEHMATAILLQPTSSFLPQFNFFPLPLEYATQDAEKIRKIKDRFHTTEWESLKEAIENVKKPFKPGIYEVPPILLTETPVIEAPDSVS